MHLHSRNNEVSLQVQAKGRKSDRVFICSIISPLKEYANDRKGDGIGVKMIALCPMDILNQLLHKRFSLWQS